jgi:hypothetical protein
MKKIIVFLVIIVLSSCEILETIEVPTQYTQASLTNTEIVNGLKEALKVGAKNSVSVLSLEDGFSKSPVYKIPFPHEVKLVEDKLRGLGFNKMIDEFVLKMNRGAENAVNKANPIFVDAIMQMTIIDAKNILRGNDNAATEYFRNKTSAKLEMAFKPEVKKTLDQMYVTKHWTNITSTYNKIPFTEDVETDLPLYVTQKTINSLFEKLAKEEKLIRHDPKARVTAILKKVFA